ncbi:Os04g0652450 [Oryza sativa Japonica Group]|uniref:Os04g0652450 protein n=1 Tax=Oryza sativa subsp. japonica TaxID=39947 RepID=A0A0N7KJU3_ORYSJ|nr:Os04g0652450 [Oryza sativa Japonica Group]
MPREHKLKPRKALAISYSAYTEDRICAGVRINDYLLGVVDDGGHDGDEAHLGGEVDDAEQRLELLQRHDDRRAGHEPDKRRLRQEIDDEPQPEDAEGGLDEAGEEGGGEGELEEEQRLGGGAHRLPQHGPHYQRRDRHRPHRQVPRAPQHRVHHRRHKARIEADDRRQARQLRVANALQDRAGDGEAGDEVGFEEGEGVAGHPVEDREQVLHRHDPLGRQRLPLEPAERVVGEEGLLHPRLQLARRALRRRRRHLV